MLKKVFLVLLSPVIFFVISCGGTGSNRIEKEELFSISLGKLADEIDYFQRDSLRFSPDNGMVMTDGFFHIANGRSGKYMKFNSYGDLMTLIYNPDRNPYPAELMSRDSDNADVNRKVIPWQFNSPGKLAVGDSIFIIDKVAPNRQVREKDVLMDRNILQFNKEGDYVNFIGIEGIGGQPFPFIENLWVSSIGELIVQYRTRRNDDETHIVNWYTQEGNLRYTVEIRESSIPMPAGEEELSISLDNIVADKEEYLLYLKMTYFRNEESGITEVFGGTLEFSVKDKQWREWSRLPENTMEIDDLEIDSPYSLVGVARGHQFFVSLGAGDDYNLLIRNKEGKFIDEQTLALERRDIINIEFSLSDTGILSAIVFRDKQADVIWWRTDRVIGTDSDNE